MDKKKKKARSSACKRFLKLSTVEALPVKLTKALRNSHKDANKKDFKTLLYIHQCVDNKVFEKTVDAYSSKAMWDTLMNFGGDAKVKRVRL